MRIATKPSHTSHPGAGTQYGVPALHGPPGAQNGVREFSLHMLAGGVIVPLVVNVGANCRAWCGVVWAVTLAGAT
jgi:hypothetical protein